MPELGDVEVRPAGGRLDDGDAARRGVSLRRRRGSRRGDLLASDRVARPARRAYSGPAHPVDASDRGGLRTADAGRSRRDGSTALASSSRRALDGLDAVASQSLLRAGTTSRDRRSSRLAMREVEHGRPWPRIPTAKAAVARAGPARSTSCSPQPTNRMSKPLTRSKSAARDGGEEAVRVVCAERSRASAGATASTIARREVDRGLRARRLPEQSGHGRPVERSRGVPRGPRESGSSLELDALPGEEPTRYRRTPDRGYEVAIAVCSRRRRTRGSYH